MSAGGIKMTLSITSSIAVGTFATVILAIASNRIHLTVAAMLGTVVLLVTGVLSARDVSETINPAEAMIALFFGGMVMARTLIATGLFDYLGAIGLRLVRGDGRRLLIAIAGLAAPICAFLPNATVVILIGPLIVAVCERMKIDFVQPLIFLVFVANSSGLRLWSAIQPLLLLAILLACPSPSICDSSATEGLRQVQCQPRRLLPESIFAF